MNNAWLKPFNAVTQTPIETAIILGSGLDFDEATFDETFDFSFDRFEGLPQPTVSGHSATFTLGFKNKTPVLVQKGRVHFYEGYSMHEVVQNIELFHALGVKTLVITNACGGMNPQLNPGDFVVLNDFINFMPSNPLVGHLTDPTFPDMTEPYDLNLRKTMRHIFNSQNVPYQEGTYVSFMGPYYETKAEIRMLSKFGDVVGMSTVPETIKARSLGIHVLGLSLVTNMATGIQKRAHDHAHVLNVASQKVPVFQSLMSAFLDAIHST